MSFGALRQRLVKVFGELGKTGPSDHEGAPCSEDHQRAGPDAVGRRGNVAGQSRLSGTLSEPTGNKAEANQRREMAAVLVVEKGREFVPIPDAP